MAWARVKESGLSQRPWAIGILLVVGACRIGVPGGEPTSASQDTSPTTEAGAESFIFRHEPVTWRLDEGIPEELLGLLEVPAGTLVPIPTRPPRESDAALVRIDILDVMRGPASSQEIDVDLLAEDESLVLSMSRLNREPCAGTTAAVDVRGNLGCVLDETEGLDLEWSEASSAFALQTSILTRDTVMDWLFDGVELVPLGTSLKSLTMPFCLQYRDLCSPDT